MVPLFMDYAPMGGGNMIFLRPAKRGRTHRQEHSLFQRFFDMLLAIIEAEEERDENSRSC